MSSLFHSFRKPVKLLTLFGVVTTVAVSCLSQPTVAQPNWDTSIWNIVQQGELEKAQALIKADPALVNAQDSIGNTPLHAVSRFYRGRTNNVKVLIDYLVASGAKINTANKAGETPLHLAAGAGDFSSHETVAALMAHNPDVKVRNKMGRTPLHVVMSSKSSALLIKAGADVNALDRQGSTPLVALAFGNSGDAGAIITQLLDAGADINHRNKLGFSAVPVLLRAWPPLPPEVFEKVDFNVTDKSRMPVLHVALANGDSEMRTIILKHYTPQDKLTQFFNATANNDVATMQKMALESKYLLNARLQNGMTPLHIAVNWNGREAINYLLTQKVDIDVRDAEAKTPLYLAARGPKRLEQVTFLLDKGADINALSKSGYSVLNSGIYANDKPFIEMLLSRGIHLNGPVFNGSTPLHYVMSDIRNRKESDDLVKLLLAKGADPNVTRPGHGSSGYPVEGVGGGALALAVSQQKIELIPALLDAGANVNQTDENDNTPLAVAAMRGDAEIVKLLLSKGANPNTRSNENQTPLDFARRKKNAEVITLLEAATAKEG